MHLNAFIFPAAYILEINANERKQFNCHFAPHFNGKLTSNTRKMSANYSHINFRINTIVFQ